MKTMQTKLCEEAAKLEKIVKRAKARLEHAPKGYLKVSNRKKRVEYYYKEEADQDAKNQDAKDQDTKPKDQDKNKKSPKKSWRYMKKSEEDLVRAMAQRDYDRDIVRSAEARISAINKFLKNYEKNCPEKVFEKTNMQRRMLIVPEVISDEEYVKHWSEAEYKGKPFGDDVNEIITERGERVRSKSEKIIADKLYALGIPYRYECPILLNGNVSVYPDFTILRVATREEVYFEHFGKMDDLEYVENTLFKLASYEKNGIFLGWNLYATFETGRKTLNSRALDVLLRKIFLEE